MESENDDVGVGRWESMSPDILALVFLKISPSADEIVKAVCLVCKGWLKVVGGPYCWSKIDVERWCMKTSPEFFNFYVNDVLEIDYVVKKLVWRSKCAVKIVSCPRLGDLGFARVAAWKFGRFLTVLKIPRGEIRDDVVKKHVGALVNLKELDISYCMWITSRGLSYFGKSCRSLTNLRRNLKDSFSHKIVREDYDGSEANAIAKTMRGLCRLEMVYGHFGDRGLNRILTNCKSLTHLNIQGCQKVRLNGDLKERCEQLLFFKPPFVFISDLEESTESESD